MERNAVAQVGISPKLLADLIISIVAFALLELLAFDVGKDPVLMAALAKGAGLLAGVIFRPGRVVVEQVGPPSDDLLPRAAHAKLVD